MSTQPNKRLTDVSRDLAAAVPWWAWLAAAAALYAVLHLIAGPDVVIAPPRSGDSGARVGRSLLESFAHLGQYFLPALCIVAGVLALRRRFGPGSERDASVMPPIEAMNPHDFEALVGRAFRMQGYHVQEAGGGSDAGIDLLMRKDRQTLVVHCKLWRAARIEADTLQAVNTAMQLRGAAGGFVLSTGRFSREAVQFAKRANIRLVDGAALQALLQAARKAASVDARGELPRPESAPAPADAAASMPAALAALAADEARTPAQPPLDDKDLMLPMLPCPLCGADMRKRLAKRGVNAGQYFWGCVKHPECRGTRRVRTG